MPECTKTDIRKKNLIEALEKTLGIVTKACKMVDVARSTFYKWYEDDKEFAKAVDGVGEIALDYVESKLFEKIDGVTIGKEKDGETFIYDTPPSDTAIIFYLKTKGKKRGYIERTETDLTTKGKEINTNHNVTFHNYKNEENRDSEKVD
jgi:hypothetical protein